MLVTLIFYFRHPEQLSENDRKNVPLLLFYSKKYYASELKFSKW